MKMIPALRALFPVGTPRSFVEQVLVGVGGARMEKTRNPALPNDYFFYYGMFGLLSPYVPKWIIHVHYDGSDRVKRVYVKETQIVP